MEDWDVSETSCIKGSEKRKVRRQFNYSQKNRGCSVPPCSQRPRCDISGLSVRLATTESQTHSLFAFCPNRANGQDLCETAVADRYRDILPTGFFFCVLASWVMREGLVGQFVLADEQLEKVEGRVRDTDDDEAMSISVEEKHRSGRINEQKDNRIFPTGWISSQSDETRGKAQNSHRCMMWSLRQPKARSRRLA